LNSSRVFLFLRGDAGPSERQDHRRIVENYTVLVHRRNPRITFEKAACFLPFGNAAPLTYREIVLMQGKYFPAQRGNCFARGKYFPARRNRFKSYSSLLSLSLSLSLSVSVSLVLPFVSFLSFTGFFDGEAPGMLPLRQCVFRRIRRFLFFPWR